MFYIAEKAGLNAESILLRAGIDSCLFEVQNDRVPTEVLACLVEGIWDESMDEAMQLSASPIPRGSLYLMAKLAVNEANLEAAILICKRFMETVSKAYTIELKTQDQVASLSFTLTAPELDHEHMLAEYILLQWHRLSSWLIAEHIPLTSTHFDFAPPQQDKEYEYLFPGEHKFNQSSLGFSFDESYLRRPMVQSASTLDAFIKSCPKELFVHPKTDYSLSNEVLAYLKHRLHSGLPTIEEAAQELNMTKRTIIRRLKLEQSSYQQLKDKVRCNRAVKLLTEQSMTVADVAEQLGYSDAAVFARAFKSWTGETPRSYKDRYMQKM
jgi:AraC-like DNA-binding protein